MELKVVQAAGNFTHIALSGKLDVAGEQAIGDQFRSLMDSHNSSFLVDMSQVTYLASLGIRMLFAGAKALASQGNKMVVVSPQPMVEETLMTSGTAKLIAIARDEAAALALLSA
jgi:anti-sigma B factor antagonist